VLIRRRARQLRILRRWVTLRRSGCGIAERDTRLYHTCVVDPVTVVIHAAIARRVNSIRVAAQTHLREVERHGNHWRRRFSRLIKARKAHIINLENRVFELTCPDDQAGVHFTQIKTAGRKLRDRNTHSFPATGAFLA